MIRPIGLAEVLVHSDYHLDDQKPGFFVMEMSWIGAITLKIVIDPAGEPPKTRFLDE